MPTFALQLRANLTGVTGLGPVDAAEFRWDVVAKCGSCGETTAKDMWVCATQQVDAHFFCFAQFCHELASEPALNTHRLRC
jgi:hypothetical protein